MSKAPAITKNEKVSTFDDFNMIDQESYDRLKQSLDATESAIEQIQKQLADIRQNEHINSIEDPCSSWDELIAKQTSLIKRKSELESELRQSKVGIIAKDDNVVSINDSVMLNLEYSDGDTEVVCKKIVRRDPDITKNEISKASDIGAAILGRRIGELVVTKIKSSGLILKIKILSKV